MKKDSEFIEFLNELDDLVESSYAHLSTVEQPGASAETIHSLYRDLHTIKGNAQLFGCKQMASLAHAMESSLEDARDHQRVPGAGHTDLMFKGLDIIKKIIKDIRATGKENLVSPETEALMWQLADLTATTAAGETPALNDPIGSIDEPAAETQILQPFFQKLQPQLAGDTADPAVENGPPSQVESAESPSLAGKNGLEHSSPDTVRVQVSLLDNLMNMIGELVLVRNQLLQHTDNNEHDANFLNLSQRLNIVTTELQNEVMKTRMQPIGNILSKFKRVVRDIQKELKKDIELKLIGVDTELDKTLLEAVNDPLTHIVRNSADHGIETREERIARQKSPKGTITIRSYHEGGQVVVEVSDDGKGLSRDRIAAKAVDKGIISSEDIQRLSDRDVYNLIFTAGFSTADQVSNLSGRGVGMDVVRTNIEKIGGVVDLSSIEGEGTTLRLKIPLTLAIVPALIVRSAEERFAIPQVKLVELVRIDSEDNGNKIELLQGKPVFRLRGHLLPLVSLNSTLNIGRENKESLGEDEVTNIAVLNADFGYFGLVLDSVEDSTDIVVKPLSKFLKNLGVYSGATVLGDGTVALVLDVIGLAHRVALFDEIGETPAQIAQIQGEVETKSRTEITEYLLIDLNGAGKYAIPLCVVNRLEEFPIESVEIAGHKRVVRYRGGILPLISTVEYLGLPAISAAQKKDALSVIVVERAGSLFGLEVESIHDVVAIEQQLVKDHGNTRGIFGNLIHNDQILAVLDAQTIISDETKFAIDELPDELKQDRSRFTILLVEDNSFFRRHVSKLLADAGFTVRSETDGLAALETLQQTKDGEIDLLVSDIEMPRMDGLELMRTVKANTRLKSIPAVALTSRFRPGDRDRGQEAGFDRYLEKLNARELLFEVDELLGVESSKREAA